MAGYKAIEKIWKGRDISAETFADYPVDVNYSVIEWPRIPA